MRLLIKKFFNDESAATSIEYAIIATGISVVIVTVVSSIGTSVAGRFTAMGTALK